MEQLSKIIRYEICGETGDLPETEISEKTIELAKKNDLLHLVSDYAHKIGLHQNSNGLDRALLMAHYRFAQQEHELEQLKKTLGTAEIEFIVLKGAVIREHYPEPWMRTSGDIDILVHGEDIQVATERLRSEPDYEWVSECTHEVALKSKSGVRIELHPILIEENRANNACRILDRIWDYADGDGYQKYLRDEMYYYYHLAHMAKHFEKSGCGIRPFIDLWILNHRVNFEPEKRNQLLIEGKLKTFEEKAQALSEKWFSQTPIDDLDALESFVLSGGTFGSQQNAISISQQKRGGKAGYILSRVFLPYSSLKQKYRVLKVCPLLYPIFLIVRLLGCVRADRKKRIRSELSQVKSNTAEALNEMGQLLESVGLG